jgi:tryptophanyl-tRNA synthetase
MKNTEFPKVIGTDGKRKMSKSEDNHIELALTQTETEEVIRTMVTDPARVRRTDPGNPDICNVFTFHKTFAPDDQVQMISTECRRAGIGCVDCKNILASNLNQELAPFRARRAEIAGNPDQVWDILREGAKKAETIAKATLSEVKEAVGLL